MKKRSSGKLALHRETVVRLTEAGLKAAAGGTLTYEGSCDNSLCPCTESVRLGDA